MKRRDSNLGIGTPDDVTDELMGHDATMDEAEVGSAGNGASPFGADFTGGYPEPIEERPDDPADILPDRVEDWPGLGADEVREGERELTARPTEATMPPESEWPGR